MHAHERELASSRLPLTQTVNVVAPPVSAPSRDVSSTAKLTLPAPAVIAPPPSQVSRDLNSWGSSATGDLRTKPVPPPPTASAGGSYSQDLALPRSRPRLCRLRRASAAAKPSPALDEATREPEPAVRSTSVLP